MRIDEAIRELELINHDGFVITRYTEFEALELGIEALKRIEEGRFKGYDYFGHHLPGETKE